jgi:tetratricopeptide (TPR) repeat protein
MVNHSRFLTSWFGMSLVILAPLACQGCGWNPFGTKEEYLRRGRAFVAQGKYEDATLQFRKALQKDDKYGEAYLGYGELLVRTNHSAQAFPVLSRAVELLPQSDEAKIALGRVAVTDLLGNPSRPQNYYQTANNMATALLGKTPNSFEGLRLKGYLAVADSHSKDTIDYFSRSLLAKPNDPEVSTMLVQTLILDHQGARAEQVARDTLSTVKTYGPLYDALYSYYLGEHRDADAEQLLKSKIANNPKEALFVIELADHYWRQKKTQDMEALLQNFVSQSKEFPAAPLDAGDLYQRIGKPDAALALYQKGLQSNPERKKDYLQRIVGVQLELGHSQQAAGVLDTILNDYPNDPEALASRADLRMSTGKPEEIKKALAEFVALLQKSPDNNKIRYSLAQAYRQVGQDSDARTALLEVLRRNPKHLGALREMADVSIRNQKPDEALQYSQRVLEIDPNNTPARLVRTAAWALSGRLSEVRSELRRLTDENPKLEEPWLQTATLNIEEKNYPEAERIYQRLYQPGNVDIRPLRGLVAVYMAQSQPKKALALLQNEISHSNNMQVRLLLASTAAETGDLDLAVATTQKLATDFPNDANHLVFLGDLNLRKGLFDQAVGNFQKAQQLAPSDPLPSDHLASALADAGHYPEAISAERRSFGLQPNNPDAMNNLAWILAMAGTNLDEAAKLARDAMAKEPANPSFTDTLGMIYLKSRKLTEAQQTFQGLVRKSSANPTYHKHLAMVWMELGRPQEARIELQSALQSRPNAPEAAEIHKLLDATH